MKLNDTLQWAGTASFMCMYTIMSFFPQSHPYEIVFGSIGGGFYLLWSLRVVNKPQILTNVVGLFICLLGLVKAWS
jgi:hypothetical protein